MLPKLVVWGTGGHAMVVVDIIRQAGKYEVVGFIDDVHQDRWNTKFNGLPVLGGKELLRPLREEGVEWLILGFGDCGARLRSSEIAKANGFNLATAIHPHSTVASDASVGPGTIVAGGAVINPHAIIGENVIINTSASVDHECVIEEGVHIAPGVHLAAEVKVGRGSWIGIGAIVIEGVKIGPHAMIGAGAVVVSDIPEGVLAYGVPAKVQKILTHV